MPRKLSERSRTTKDLFLDKASQKEAIVVLVIMLELNLSRFKLHSLDTNTLENMAKLAPSMPLDDKSSYWRFGSVGSMSVRALTPAESRNIRERAKERNPGWACNA